MNTVKIVIIDDNAQTAEMLKEFVHLMGYESIVYTQASQYFSENHTAEDSLLLLDLHMPEMDGVEVMRQLVERNLSPAIILISGYDAGVLHSAEQLAEEYSLKVIGTLTKPLKFSSLKNIVSSYIETKINVTSVQNNQKITATVDELEQAISKQQFLLHYQPKVNLESGELIGVEALIRWQHPQYGLVYPDFFIPLAEQRGLISGITSFVVKKSIEQLVFWHSHDLKIQVAVNISADNITSLSLPEQLVQQLSKNDIDPAFFTLEVTESVLMEKLATSLDILTRLRMNIGVMTRLE